MLSAKSVEEIRRDHFETGISLRQIARDRNLSRNTVRKAVRSGEDPFRYERSCQPRPKLGPWTGELERLLEENCQRHCHDRLPLTRLHETLTSIGFEGGYDAVRRYAAEWRQVRRRSLPPQATIPTRFDPGEAYRFDWSHEDVVLAGTTTRANVAHVRLCYSHMFFVQAYPRATQEMWFDAHERAFQFLGGACRTGIYNHMKPSVRRLVALSARRFKPEFHELCAHYRVKPAACMPGEDWELGTTERQLRDARQDLFLPRPEAASFAEINALLVERCIAIARCRPHPAIPDRTIWQVFEDERPLLSSFNQGFDGFRQFVAEASDTCLVPFDHNHYSVHARAAGQRVEIRAYAERLVIRMDGNTIAEHARSFRRGRVVYDPWHYVPMLPGKPCALRSGAPFKNWRPPGAIGRMRGELAAHPDGDKQFVAILSEIPRMGLDAVEFACERAVARNDWTAAAVKRNLARPG